MKNESIYPKDLTKYPKKVWLGLNLRQLIFLALSIALGIPFFFGVKNDLALDISLFLSALVSLPIGCLGFVKVRGMYIEIIARTLFIQGYIRFKERKLLEKK